MNSSSTATEKLASVEFIDTYLGSCVYKWSLQGINGLRCLRDYGRAKDGLIIAPYLQYVRYRQILFHADLHNAVVSSVVGAKFPECMLSAFPRFLVYLLLSPTSKYSTTKIIFQLEK